MSKRLFTDEERKERKRAASRRYQAKRRLDPGYRVMEAAKSRANYKIKKLDPTYVARENARSLKTYHEKTRPFQDKMEQRRSKVRSYQQNLRERRLEIKLHLQQILGARCVSCGLTDHRLLDFDHIDPKKKTMVISQSLGKPLEMLLEEIKNCQLMCPNCHRLKTIEQFEHDAYKNREYRNKYRTTFKPLSSSLNES